ncbi:hypothetical protein HPB47_022886 [Ixodes persulcatus]|uniref:Uncharacterized protein n=1 Tax=Ixodes persulcatus TaxID=34615 RepID=A0AC60Q9A4_IXOPE|nr:hypothetical protein HPB47_022886 [Ixodes persulcatus]
MRGAMSITGVCLIHIRRRDTARIAAGDGVGRKWRNHFWGRGNIIGRRRFPGTIPLARDRRGAGAERADDRRKRAPYFTAPALSFAGSLFVWRPRKKPGTFRCDVCGKPFSNKANMQRHKVLHATVRDVYFCDVCSRPFSWKSSLERHKRDMHGIPGALPARGDAGGVFPDLV